MKLVGIDIGKHKHFVSIVDKLTGEIILQPVAFSNNAQGFEFLISQIALYRIAVAGPRLVTKRAASSTTTISSWNLPSASPCS